MDLTLTTATPSRGDGSAIAKITKNDDDLGLAI
jgi:hypothetical protein